MSNVTFAIEDDLLRKAKMAAVQMDTSPNSIVRTLLAGIVSAVGEPTKQTVNYRKLLDFSLGRIPHRKLMAEMGSMPFCVELDITGSDAVARCIWAARQAPTDCWASA